jgi:hypothetical protein
MEALVEPILPGLTRIDESRIDVALGQPSAMA